MDEDTGPTINLQNSLVISSGDYTNDIPYQISTTNDYDGFTNPFTLRFSNVNLINVMNRILYKQPTSTSGTSTNNRYINFNSTSLTKTTGTAGTNWEHNIPASKVFFAITKGGDSFHLYGCYNSNTSGTKLVKIKLPSSSNVVYYNEEYNFVNNPNVADREILYVQNSNNKNLTSISMDSYVNATDLTSIYFYTNTFKVYNLTF